MQIFPDEMSYNAIKLDLDFIGFAFWVFETWLPENWLIMPSKDVYLKTRVYKYKYKKELIGHRLQ